MPFHHKLGITVGMVQRLHVETIERRIFTYATTSAFFNAISAAIGPFTETPICERMLTGAINIRVSTAWGKAC